MVLCSIEEAWGTSFNNLEDKPPQKNIQNVDNRHRYAFSRDSRPLSEHNGCVRDQSRHTLIIDNKKNIREPSPPEHNVNNNDDPDSDSYENFENDPNDYQNENRFQPIEEENDFENYETFNKNEDRGNIYIDDEDNGSDDEFEGEEENNISKNINSDKQNEYYNNYESESEEPESGITNNMSIILDRLNKLMNLFEQNTQSGNNGMKDIFIFVIVGIFLIFILDLIFRIGQKITK